MELDHVVKLYNCVLDCVMVKHAPIITRKLRSNRSPWWSLRCQEAISAKRWAKRNIKHADTVSEATNREKCIDAAIIINRGGQEARWCSGNYPGN